MSKLYLAYGSNLNISQMQCRCPDARIAGTAVLSGWKLMFKGSWTGNYLTIEQDEDSVVPVAVWEVSEQDEKNLDRYEGYPDLYYKKELSVMMREKDSGQSRSVKAFVYIMHEDRRHGCPSESYLMRCREGYGAFGFDTAFLDEAYEFSRKQLLSE